MKELQIDKIKQHNVTIEMKYLENQINKFKEEISLQRPKSIIKNEMLSLNSNDAITNDNNNMLLQVNPLDNKKLFSSLQNGYEMVQNFYKNSSDASIEENKILHNDEDDDDDENFLSSSNYDDNIESTTTQQQQSRCVRFDNFVEIINYAGDDEEPSTSQDCSLIDLESSEDSKSENSTTEPAKSLLAIELIPKKCTEEPFELVGKQVIHDVVNAKQPIKPIFKSPRPDDLKPIVDTIDENPLRVIKINLSDNLPATSNPSNGKIDENFQQNTEQSAIINELFAQSVANKELDRMLLQKYFLKWTHFTTMQKLTKENLPKDASRIRKIEQFLDNIRIEKKKFLRKDPIDTTVSNDGQMKKPNFDNPIILAKKYQNKLVAIFYPFLKSHI